MFDDSDRLWQRSNERSDGLRSNRRMGAIRNQNGDGSFANPSSLQPLDHARKHLGEACLPRGVRDNDSCRLPPTSDIHQGRTSERLIEGVGGQRASIATGRGARGQCANSKPAKIESQLVGGKWEFDNHGVTIPSW